MRTLVKDVRNSAIEKLRHGVRTSRASELHNNLFNEDYYIVGTYEAKQWLGEEAFDAIEKIKTYENDNFGQVSTDLADPEKVVNMLAYILGEEVLQGSEILQGKLVCDGWLESEDCKAIAEELENS